MCRRDPAGTLVGLALRNIECQGRRRRSAWRGTQARRAPRDRRGLRRPPRSRSAPRRWSSGTGSGSRPATVRNDMAALEEEGLITQPHTSAGRVPTDKGYRLFVDRLDHGQADERRPSSARSRTILDGAVDLDDVVAALGAAARPADPPGRGRAVPHAVPLDGPPRRAGRAGADPAAGGADPQHRPGRAARWSSSPTPLDDDDARRPAGPAQPARSPASVIADGRAALARCPSRTPPSDGAARPARRRRPASRRCPTTAPTSGSRSAAPPTSPASATASTSPSARCSRRSRSTSCCSSCSARRTTGGTVTVRIGHEGPYQELASTSVVATGYGPGDEALGNLGVRRPDPHGLPRDDGGGARGRALRLPHPRRGLRGHMTADHRSLRSSSASPATPTPTRSRRPTAGWPGSCTPTSTPTRRRRSSSRRSRAPTRCLSDPQKRAAYDRGGDPFGGGGGGFGAGLLLHRHHGRVLRRPGAGRRRAAVRARAVRRGQDALIRLEVDLAEAAFGVTRELKVDTAVRLHDVPRRGRRARHPPGAPARSAAAPARSPHVQRSFLGEIRTLRPCAACRGFGTIIPDPCRECSGDGRVRVAPHAHRQDPGRRRHRHPGPARRPGRGRPRRRPGRRPLRRDPRRRRTRSFTRRRQRPALHGRRCR